MTTALSLGLIIVLLIVEAIQSAGAAGAIGRMTARGAVAAPAWPLRWIAGAAMLLGIFLLGVSSSGFIYGKF